MTVATPHHRYAYADYLALEASSNVKHEYFNGEIYAMAGGTPEHAALASAVAGLLFPQLRGGACRIFSSDLRVRVLSTGLATYPDLSVVCGPLEHDPDNATTVVNPRVVFEVLSDGTEHFDRGEKLDHYRQIPSLTTVVLIASREKQVQTWTRVRDDEWQLADHAAGSVVDLAAISARIGVNELYEAAGV